MIFFFIFLFSPVVSGGKVRSLLSFMFSSQSLFYTVISSIHLEFIFDERNIVLIFFPMVSQLPNIIFWNVTFIVSQTFMDIWVYSWTLLFYPFSFLYFIELKTFLLIEVTKYIVLSSRANYLFVFLFQDFFEQPHIIFCMNFNTVFKFLLILQMLFIGIALHV